MSFQVSIKAQILSLLYFPWFVPHFFPIFLALVPHPRLSIILEAMHPGIHHGLLHVT